MANVEKRIGFVNQVWNVMMAQMKMKKFVVSLFDCFLVRNEPGVLTWRWVMKDSWKLLLFGKMEIIYYYLASYLGT